MNPFLQGAAAALYVQWREYAPDGPPVAVTAVTITVTSLAGGAPMVGPTTVGVSNPTVGVNTYTWQIPDAQPAGDYLVVWNGVDPGDDSTVTTSEVITVLAGASETAPAGLCDTWEPIWCCDLPTGAAAVTGVAVQSATEVMWQASGQRFGLCTVTLRPCRRDCAGGPWPEWPGWPAAGWPQPTLRDGQWFNVGCGGCGDSCTCTDLEEAVLPAPVYDIVQVLVDGVALSSSAYRLDNDRLLVRVDGGLWPSCQRLDLADTEVGTWSVTARFGEPAPTLGRQAVGELACEIARACLGEDCQLPANVVSLVRQGVSITLPDAKDIAGRGYFGGLFLQTYNPHRLRGRPQVYDVDGPAFRRTGT